MAQSLARAVCKQYLQLFFNLSHILMDHDSNLLVAAIYIFRILFYLHFHLQWHQSNTAACKYK